MSGVQHAAERAIEIGNAALIDAGRPPVLMVVRGVPGVGYDEFDHRAAMLGAAAIYGMDKHVRCFRHAKDDEPPCAPVADLLAGHPCPRLVLKVSS